MNDSQKMKSKHREDKRKIILSLIKNPNYQMSFVITYLGSKMTGYLIEYDEHKIYFGKDSGLWLYIDFSLVYRRFWVHYSSIESVTIHTLISNHKDCKK